ncbi:hypothetical protein GF327_01775 [Candidatus Woesearchaeota archaeon]|nr:hypothetical protein [Candidatus Woesearchaeota archaeon]
MLNSRKINTFEKILLPVGVSVAGFGLYFLIQADVSGSELAWLKMSSFFSWLSLLILMVIAAINVDMKEELVILTKDHNAEIKLLKELNHDQLEEIKLLRKDLKKK